MQFLFTFCNFPFCLGGSGINEMHTCYHTTYTHMCKFAEQSFFKHNRKPYVQCHCMANCNLNKYLFERQFKHELFYWFVAFGKYIITASGEKRVYLFQFWCGCNMHSDNALLISACCRLTHQLLLILGFGSAATATAQNMSLRRRLAI